MLDGKAGAQNIGPTPGKRVGPGLGWGLPPVCDSQQVGL